ncbi:MAG TPA: hypothetical protein VFW88_00565 [Burkholderiales bacterium]|nr:hypothetical protein [Burkholderiales bacterium]
MNENDDAVPMRGHGLRMFASLSLNAQIDDAQLRVAERHRAVGACVTSLSRHVRARATSMPGLMLAASVGFIAAEVARLLDAGARARSTPGARGAALRSATRVAQWGRILFTFIP